jgi:O-antigen ligase
LPAALMLLAAFMLATIGGRYAWPVLPGLIAAAALFLASGARVGAEAATRSIDFTVIAALAFIGLQLAPLPPALVHAFSPGTPSLQDAYALEPLGTWRPLSIHPAATRAGFVLALAAALVFWAAREAFSRGGSRAAARLLAWIGFGCAVVSLAQRATAPRTVLWTWTVPDPRAVPFGPFVDRNQLATWLVLAICLVGGYLAMHVRAHMTDRLRQGSHAVLVALSDGGSIVTIGCLAAMLLTLAATLSRSGFVALVAAVVVGTSLGRRERGRALWVGLAAAAVLLGVAAWLNLEGLVERIMSTLAPPDPSSVSRLTIWRDTLHIVRAFPLFGTGQGTFADAMFVSQQTARQVLFNHAHDEYLQLLTEGGVVLLVLVLCGLALLARAARRRLAADEGSHRFVRIGACAGLVAVAVQSIWETGLRAPANLLLAAILAALAVVDRGEPSSEITPA